MLKGFRGIFLALGLILAAASPPRNGAQGQQEASKQSAEQSLRDIAAALQDANEPDHTNDPCSKEQENRSSDLCAQWKAADAASAAAIWTERTFYLGIGGLVIGSLTLIAAAAAAIFAKKAAIETEKGANAAKESVIVTRELGVAQLRGYLAFDTEVRFGCSRRSMRNKDTGEVTVEPVNWNISSMMYCQVTQTTQVRDITIVGRAIHKVDGVKIDSSPGRRSRTQKFNFGSEVFPEFCFENTPNNPLPRPSSNQVRSMTFVFAKYTIFDGSEIRVFCCFDHSGAVIRNEGGVATSIPSKRLIRFRERRVPIA